MLQNAREILAGIIGILANRDWLSPSQGARLAEDRGDCAAGLHDWPAFRAEASKLPRFRPS